MRSKWRVLSNPIGPGEFLYQVYRIRDTNKADHSGNREIFSIHAHKDDAQMVADKLNKILDILPALKSAEPRGDLISRQDAVSIFMQRAKELAGLKGDIGGACEGAAKLIKSLPSAEPKHGEWLYKESDHGKCSECGAWVFELYPFCPNCGADMRGKTHE